MTFSTRNFDPLTPLSHKFPNFAIQILLIRLKHTVAVVTHAHVLQNFYTTWVRGVAFQKQCLGPKLEGGGARLGEHPKIWGPLRISATVETSNFKFGTQLGFGTSLPNKKLSYRWQTARCWFVQLSLTDQLSLTNRVSLTNRAMLVCTVVEVWQDFLSEYVDKKYTYICYRRLIRHEWIYYGSKNCVIYNSYKIV